MKKQTAVEWLIETLAEKGILHSSDIAFAKNLEKKQLCYFYVKGAEAELNNPYVSNVEFYNKTFNK